MESDDEFSPPEDRARGKAPRSPRSPRPAPEKRSRTISVAHELETDEHNAPRNTRSLVTPYIDPFANNDASRSASRNRSNAPSRSASIMDSVPSSRAPSSGPSNPTRNSQRAHQPTAGVSLYRNNQNQPKASSGKSLTERIPKQVSDQLATLTEKVTQLCIDMKKEKKDTDKLFDNANELTGNLEGVRALIDDVQDEVRDIEADINDIKQSLQEVLAAVKQIGQKHAKDEPNGAELRPDHEDDDGYDGDGEAGKPTGSKRLSRLCGSQGLARAVLRKLMQFYDYHTRPPHPLPNEQYWTTDNTNDPSRSLRPTWDTWTPNREAWLDDAVKRAKISGHDIHEISREEITGLTTVQIEAAFETAWSSLRVKYHSGNKSQEQEIEKKRGKRRYTRKDQKAKERAEARKSLPQLQGADYDWLFQAKYQSSDWSQSEGEANALAVGKPTAIDSDGEGPPGQTRVRTVKAPAKGSAPWVRHRPLYRLAEVNNTIDIIDGVMATNRQNKGSTHRAVQFGAAVDRALPAQRSGTVLIPRSQINLDWLASHPEQNNTRFIHPIKPAMAAPPVKPVSAAAVAPEPRTPGSPPLGPEDYSDR
ncbi:hypothetical protein PHLGIDRAFT_120506 [Phlebiopsis gigantea 11061_1 CR5-6]|uniref:Uncharacterized protein n=1 Tax=Phlebiopsis gigantea (strain 11061_1 CR5-6) TaxID=745531 RepID=A0A0C3PG50_PHLG1|nr:hypothetical protein PHLGIDRAFT_120506 [Phlebiopsis gigantea 11061_1 CR5-6]